MDQGKTVHRTDRNTTACTASGRMQNRFPITSIFRVRIAERQQIFPAHLHSVIPSENVFGMCVQFMIAYTFFIHHLLFLHKLYSSGSAAVWGTPTRTFHLTGAGFEVRIAPVIPDWFSRLLSEDSNCFS